MIPLLLPETAPIPLKGATATPNAPPGGELFDALFAALTQISRDASAVTLPDAASAEPDDTIDLEVAVAEPEMPIQVDHKLVPQMAELPHTDVVDVHIKLAVPREQPERVSPTAELPDGATVEAVYKFRAEDGAIEPPKRGSTIAQAIVERQLGASDIVPLPDGKPDRSSTAGQNLRALVEPSTIQPATQGAAGRLTLPSGAADGPKMAAVVAEQPTILPAPPKTPPVRDAAAKPPQKGTGIPVLQQGDEVVKQTDRAALPVSDDAEIGKSNDLISRLPAPKPKKTDPGLTPATVKETAPAQPVASQMAVSAPPVTVAPAAQPEKTGKPVVVSDPVVDASIPLGSVERVSTARATAAPQTPVTTEGARQAAQQIAVAVNAQPGRATEIALNPEELGRVRLSMTAVDATITLNVLAERPETTDLLRRHIDVLAQEFRDLGYEDITFSFGARAHADNGGSDEQQSELVTPDDNSDGPAPTTTRSASGGLDLRI